jgi:hypothetical protein
MPDAAPARTPGFFGYPPLLLETSSTTRARRRVRGSSHPIAAFRHEFPDANGHRIRLDDAFDCGFAVRIVGARKGARDHSAVPRAIAHKLVRRSSSLEANAPQQTGTALTGICFSSHSSPGGLAVGGIHDAPIVRDAPKR